MLEGRRNKLSRHESLESRVRGNSQARFGGGPTEKARASGTSPAAYPTLREPEAETHSGDYPELRPAPMINGVTHPRSSSPPLPLCLNPNPESVEPSARSGSSSPRC